MSGKVIVRETVHTIKGKEYVFQQVTSTNADPDTILIHMKDGDEYRAIFKGDYKAYEMFCVVANEYRGY